MRYFISDTHYIDGDYQTDNILNWERNQFSTIKREDLVLLQNNKIDVSASRALTEVLGQK